MNFDPSHKPNRNKLPADIVRLMNRAFFERRAKGLNVQFLTDFDILDEWSFEDEKSRDAFVRHLNRIGREYVLSPKVQP